MTALSPGIILLIVILAIIFSGIYTVQQGTIAVITMFGKYRRVARPGLNIKIPFLRKNIQTYFYSKPVGRVAVSGHHPRSGECEL
jgi:regulator of protease activity HflC (stomatin/prohibitin superfamily)